MGNKGALRRTKVTTLCMHCSCCDWRKDTSSDKVTSNSEEFRPVALPVIELRLSKAIS